jgi:hypothetical protein
MLRVTTMVTALLITSVHGGMVTIEGQGLIAAGHHARVVPLRDDARYAYLRSEIERLGRSGTFECRNIAMAARHWWEENRVYGFTERVDVVDATTGVTGYLAGEARAPRSEEGEDNAYVMHLYLANRTRKEILTTFRHESAHAAGITDESEARLWAKQCR